jgi:hypothetical protein
VITFHEHMTMQARSYIVSVLLETEGNATEAAKISGVQRQRFYKLLRYLSLKCDDYRPLVPHRVNPAFRRWIGRLLSRHQKVTISAERRSSR